MATVSRPSPAPVGLRGGSAARALQTLPALAVVVGVPVVLWLAYQPSYVKSDARYAILWARDILHGHTPDYTAPFAPTPHPLQTLAGFLTLPFGDDSARVMVALTLLSLGALTWLVYRLGAQLWSPAVGVVAAVVVATRPSLDRFALVGYQDVAFAALVVWALLLEVRRPRRGPAVLAVLALAGLMRPDAWMLSALYVAYLWRGVAPRERAALVSLALVAPVLWMVQDWIVTGHPLHSLQGTRALAEEVNRRRPPRTIPKRTLWYFELTMLWPLVAGLPIGLAFAWGHRRRRWSLLLATAAALAAFTVVASLAGLSLVQRYVVTPSALLALVYALGAIGWSRLPPGRSRQTWRALGLLSLAFSLAYLPFQAGKFHTVAQTMKRETNYYSGLRQAATSHAVRAKFASCGAISTTTHDAAPDTRYWLDAPSGSVRVAEDGGQIAPLLLEPHTRRQPNLPAGYRRLYQDHSWVVYARSGCTRARLAAAPGAHPQPASG